MTTMVSPAATCTHSAGVRIYAQDLMDWFEQAGAQDRFDDQDGNPVYIQADEIAYYIGIDVDQYRVAWQCLGPPPDPVRRLRRDKEGPARRLSRRASRPGAPRGR